MVILTILENLKLGVYKYLHIVLVLSLMSLVCLIGFTVDYRDFIKSNIEPDGKEFQSNDNLISLWS